MKITINWYVLAVLESKIASNLCYFALGVENLFQKPSQALYLVDVIATCSLFILLLKAHVWVSIHPFSPFLVSFSKKRFVVSPPHPMMLLTCSSAGHGDLPGTCGQLSFFKAELTGSYRAWMRKMLQIWEMEAKGATRVRDLLTLHLALSSPVFQIKYTVGLFPFLCCRRRYFNLLLLNSQNKMNRKFGPYANHKQTVVVQEILTKFNWIVA